MNRTIIVIDDDQALLDSIGLVLTAHGYNVLKFLSATEALEHLKQSGPTVDLIVSDIQMPDMWAQKFLTLLKRIPTIGYIPVIVQSGADFQLIQQCIELGAVGYIRKPYSPKDLLRLIEDTLARKPNQCNGFVGEPKRDKMIFVAGSIIHAGVNGGFML